MGKVSGGFVESGDQKIAIVDNVPIADGVPNRHCCHWRSTMDTVVTIGDNGDFHRLYAFRNHYSNPTALLPLLPALRPLSSLSPLSIAF